MVVLNIFRILRVRLHDTAPAPLTAENGSAPLTASIVHWVLYPFLSMAPTPSTMPAPAPCRVNRPLTILHVHCKRPVCCKCKSSISFYKSQELPSFAESLGLTSPDYYYYLNQSATYRVDGLDDNKEFNDTFVRFFFVCVVIVSICVISFYNPEH